MPNWAQVMASCSLEGGSEAESAGDGDDEEGREGEGKLSTDAGRFSYI